MHEHRGAAAAVALTALIFLMTLGAVVVILGWLGLTVYAVVAAVRGSAHPSPLVVSMFFVLLVGTLVTAFAGSLSLVGRSMSPRKRRRDDLGP